MRPLKETRRLSLLALINASTSSSSIDVATAGRKGQKKTTEPRTEIVRQSSDSVHNSNSTVLHSTIKIVDLPYNNRDKLVSFNFGK